MICDKEGRIQYADPGCEKLGIIRGRAGEDNPQELYPEKNFGFDQNNCTGCNKIRERNPY